MEQLTIVKHPLVQHKLSIMRSKNTPSSIFRQLLDELTYFVLYEVTKDFPTTDALIETPLTTAPCPVLADTNITIAPIFRAGLGMQDAALKMLPFANVAYIGVYRDEQEDGSIELVEYYFKAAPDIHKNRVIVLDPMLATGTSAVSAINSLKKRGCTDIRFVCIIAAPQGVKTLTEAHPDVPIYTASVDEGLNEHAYILPGIGDAGDRIFRTV